MQVPVVHVAVALGSEHGTPQAPQFVSVRVLVSQPSASRPLQLAKPALHMPRRQLPVEQSSVAFASAQGTLHAPQSVSVFPARSQPLVASASQLSQSRSQDGAQPASSQDVVPCSLVHAIPQSPQSSTVSSGVSQSAKTASQSPMATGQPGGHVSAVHGPM